MAARRFFQTPPTMAHPSGRIAVHIPTLGGVYVVNHIGQWDAVPGREKPGTGWSRLTVKAARERLAAEGVEQAHEDTPA